MSRPWMPLYIADYLRDTRQLTTAEHGAYLLLIMEYWTVGELPADDRKLARIAGMTAPEWRKAKPNVQTFFTEGWRHKRIDHELKEAERISNAGRKAGLASANARRNKQPTIDQRLFNETGNDPTTICQPSPSPKKEDAASAASVDQEVDLFRRGKEVLGVNSGGLIKNLLAAKGGKVTDARAAIETAAGKQNPREYIGGVIRKREEANQPKWNGIEGVL